MKNNDSPKMTSLGCIVLLVCAMFTTMGCHKNSGTSTSQTIDATQASTNTIKVPAPAIPGGDQTNASAPVAASGTKIISPAANHFQPPIIVAETNSIPKVP